MTFRHVVVIMIIINYLHRRKFIKNMYLWVFVSYPRTLSSVSLIILIWSTYCFFFFFFYIDGRLIVKLRKTMNI